MRPRRSVTTLTAALTGLALVAGPSMADAAPAKPTPGSAGSGDSLFPSFGNGGYDARHYDVWITWSPSNRIVARTHMRGRAHKRLSRFNLDLARALKVRGVRVNGARARFARQGHELVITPKRALPRKKAFHVTVRYAGTPKAYVDPDGSREGWIRTGDGATAVNEPVGAFTWMPVNNTIRDKASYRFIIRAPRAKQVAANGSLVKKRVGSTTATWTWRQRQPISAYLSTIAIGRFDVKRSTTASGIRNISFLDPDLGGQSMIRTTNRATDTWQRRFGKYPFSTTGAIVDDVRVGYALETATRPVYDGPAGDSTVVHEIAHQWWGNAVTPRDWSGIWLNEGFATYAEWLWRGKSDPGYPRRHFRQIYRSTPAGDPLWTQAPTRPTAATMFGEASYLRGAMALQALRERIGSKAFFTVLRRWYAQHQYGSVTTMDLKRLAERVSGKQLDTLFHDWLYATKRPRHY